MIEPRRQLATTIVLVFVSSVLSAQDAVSMASPTREAIWTARLLIIAINDGDERTARGMFTPDAVVTFLGRSISAEERDDWLSEEVFYAGVGVRVRRNDVEGRGVRISADWEHGGASAPVVLSFVQSDDGRIKSLDVLERR